MSATYDGSNIEKEEDVLSYDADTNTFTIDTDDMDLMGEAKPYTIKAEL